MKKKGRRHLTPYEIKEHCKSIAREKRMADRTPWTITAIVSAYVLMQQEGFKGKRIAHVTGKINELEEKWTEGSIKLEDIQQRLQNKADWSIVGNVYKEDDIKARKGSFMYWLDSKQIEAQNVMNEQAARYLLFFYNTLMEEYGYGKERLTRIQNYMDSILPEYQVDKSVLTKWRKALLDEAGVVMELPVDPLTQTSGSIMTG